MTDGIRYIPQIADYFGVTKEYVFSVYTSAQMSEATIWSNMVVAWLVLVILGGFVFGFVSLLTTQDTYRMFTEFCIGFAIGVVIFAIIGAIGCLLFGVYAIQAANPEYMTWVSYTLSLKYA
jgi:hypothetical protein